MSTILSTLKSTFQPILQFIYPPACFACGTLMEDGNSRVCETCWSGIRTVTPEDQLYKEMHSRLTQTPDAYISDLISLFHFEKEGTLQSIIHQLKYNGMTILGEELGRKLGERVMARRVQLDGIVPVPLHSVKKRERGYNQSEFIASGIREVTGLPVYTSLLTRHKYTTSQTHLSAAERRENVGDAFTINKRYLLDVQDKTLLVVDDVITTGATVEACAEALMQNGAGTVLVGSVAIAEHSVDSSQS